MSNCPQCDGTGWRPVKARKPNGVEYSAVAPCDCPAGRKIAWSAQDARQRAEAAKARPGGFASVKDTLDRVIGASADRAIGPSVHRIIETPDAGTRHPNTIEDRLRDRPGLRDLLSREDLIVAKLIQARVGKSAAIQIKDLVGVLGDSWSHREVKGAVEKLRTLARMPIVASKEPPYGYFLPSTAEECDEAFNRYVREGIKLFLIARLVKPSANLVQHLRGQLELGETGKSVHRAIGSSDHRIIERENHESH